MGNPVRKYNIYLFANPLFHESQEIFINNPDGQFNISGLLPETSYDLNIKALGFGELKIRNSQTGKRLLTFDDISLPKADRWLEGIVKDTDGNPVTGTAIQISGYDSEFQRSYTNNLGYYRFNGISSLAIPRIVINHQKLGQYEFSYIPTNEKHDIILIIEPIAKVF